MNGAKLKTMREGLGLSASFLAEKSGVALRTLQYWESGKSTVPQDVIDFILDLESKFDLAEKHALDIAKKTKPQDIELIRYKSDEDLLKNRPDMKGLNIYVHAALLNRVRRVLEKNKFKVIFKFYR